LQGKQFEGVAEALRDGDLETAGLEPPERLLLEFVGTISRAAYRVTDEQVHGLREVGWTDEQIAEAAYVAALFSLFVRLADTFLAAGEGVSFTPDGASTAGAGWCGIIGYEQIDGPFPFLSFSDTAKPRSGVGSAKYGAFTQT